MFQSKIRNEYIKLFIKILFICVFSPLFSQNVAQNAFNKALSFHYTNKDSAYFYYKKTIKLADKDNNLELLVSSYLYLINANGVHYDLINYGINLKKEKILLFNDKRLDTLKNLKMYKIYYLYDKGGYYYKLKQYTTAKKSFKKIYNLLSLIPKNKKNSTDLRMLSSVYSFLGLIYYHNGKYDLAESLLKKDIQLQYNYKDSIVDWQRRLYNTKKLLANVYLSKKQFYKTDTLLKESLSFFKTKTGNPIFKNAILSTYVLLEKSYIKQKKYQKALTLLNQKKTYFKEDKNPFFREIDIYYGDVYFGLKKYQKALAYYHKSLVETKKYRHGKHQDIAKIYAKIGTVFIQKQQFNEGLKKYQFALAQLQKNFKDTLISSNPNPEKVIDKLDLLRILKTKLNALKVSFETTKNLHYLEIAHKTSKVIIKTLDLIRPEFESKLDKEFLVEETYPSIQKMVDISYKLYHLTNNEKYINDAFFFIEKSKSIFLLDGIRNSQATKYGNIPKSILTKEQQYRAKITYLEKRLFNDKNKPIDSIKYTLDSIKTNYYTFINNLEIKYPNYYTLKYNNKVVSLVEQANIIGENSAFLNFLVANNNLYLIVVESNQKEFYKIDFNKHIQKKIKNLYHHFANINIKDDTFYKNSYDIYNILLSKALQNSKALDLTISANDILIYLPFEALNTSENKESFLLKTHSISYASSATMLKEQNKQVPNKKPKLLVFAPKFTGKTNKINHERTNLTPLFYNEQEAKYISPFFHAKILKNKEASIVNFKKEIVNYNLLHFATHASANDKFPDYSYLAFSNDSVNTNLLYVKDLYNYTINADLVTLSACETGIGKLQKGEGVLSLARAFNYAGVPAMVNTLWKIDDQSTSEIMAYFYENLNNGLSKKEALRQAKLTYLELNEDAILRHPYYWSGIVLTGNVEQVAFTNYFIWILLGVLLLISFYYIFKKHLSYKTIT